jgi:hypothetical protein
MDEEMVKLIQDAYETFTGEVLSDSEVLDLVDAFEANGLEIIAIDQDD